MTDARTPPSGAPPQGLTSLRHDVGRKLTALVLGILAWVLIDSQVVGERTLALDVVQIASLDVRGPEAGDATFYLVVPPTLVLEEISHETVEVRIRGLREEVEDLRISRVVKLDPGMLEGEARRVIDLSLDETSDDFVVEPADAHLSKFSVHPRTLTLTLARRARARVSLRTEVVAVTGAPREGHVFDPSKVEIVPSEVYVSGPQDLVDAVVADPTILHLEPVDVADKIARVVAQVGLDRERVDARLKMETVQGVLQVTVPIVPAPASVQLLGVAVTYRNAEALEASGRRVLSASPSLDLRVEGPAPWFAAQAAQDLRDRIHLLVDWAQVGSLPRGFYDVRVLREDIPDTVRITDLAGKRPQIEYSLEEIGDSDP